MHKSCAQEMLDHLEAHPTLGTRKGDEVIRFCTEVIENPDPTPPGKPPGGKPPGKPPGTGQPSRPSRPSRPVT